MRHGRGRARHGGGVLAALMLVLSVPVPVALAQQAPGAGFSIGSPAVSTSVPHPTGGEEPVIRLPSPILTLDWERLFEGTLYGKRIRADLARESQAQEAENDRIADQLIAEEKALTEKRATMPAAEFQTAADAFDARASEIRRIQNAKSQALTQRYEDEREVFFAAVGPMIDEVLAKRGAVAVLDRRVVIRSLTEADMTADLIHLVDTRLGDGPQADPGGTTPDTAASDTAPATPEPADTAPDTPKPQP